jgi:ribosomal protein L13
MMVMPLALPTALAQRVGHQHGVIFRIIEARDVLVGRVARHVGNSLLGKMPVQCSRTTPKLPK